MVDERTYTILVVTDHHKVRDSVDNCLRYSGFGVLTAANAEQARIAATENDVDLILLDITTPGEDGISLCRHLREAHSTPVVLLTTENEGTDPIIGLEAGADDFVVEPLNPRELVARAKATLRRLHTAPPQPTPFALGAISFDYWCLQCRGKRLVSACGTHERKLTGAEYQLLMVFLHYPGRVLGRDELLGMSCGRQVRPFDRTVDNQVRRLRKKIEKEPSRPRVIRTVWGHGYCLDVDVERQSG